LALAGRGVRISSGLARWGRTHRGKFVSKRSAQRTHRPAALAATRSLRPLPSRRAWRSPAARPLTFQPICQECAQYLGDEDPGGRWRAAPVRARMGRARSPDILAVGLALGFPRSCSDSCRDDQFKPPRPRHGQHE